MLGNGSGGFGNLVPYSALKGNLFIRAIGDLNNDQRPDAITVDSNNVVSLWLNKGDGSFDALVPIVTASGPLNGAFTPLIGDFNGDGNLDLACNCGPSFAFEVLLGEGNGKFQAPEPSQQPSGVPLDVNGDGRLDFVSGYQFDAGDQFFLAHPDGTFQAQPPINLPAPLVTADFNGDGKPDLAGLNGAMDHVNVMIGAPTPNWSQQFPQNSPSPRSNHAMACDLAHDNLVLFGGVDLSQNGTPVADTWTWDGVNWTQQSPANPPPARFGAGMAYDAAHDQMVLFGGQVNNSGRILSSTLNDTWLWNGAIWIVANPTSVPPVHSFHQLAYDAAHRQTVLFAGALLDAQLIDTWLWDGSNWTDQVTPATPSPRYGHAMVYDCLRNQVVLFGGDGPVKCYFAGCAGRHQDVDWWILHQRSGQRVGLQN